MTRVEQMIQDIREAEGCMGGIKLNQWEEEFMDNIEDCIGEGKTLTRKQLLKLEEIWERI